MSKALYDIDKSWEENLNSGPNRPKKIPERTLPPREDWHDFLGFKVASRIGVFAGPLLDSKWIALASELGFDLLTYKTIRSQENPGHPLPNILYIDQKKPFDPVLLPLYATTTTAEPSVAEMTITNSFGMPSKDPKFLSKDIKQAKGVLKEGQVLIVSITGSEKGDGGKASLIEDFVKAARLAKESGAQVIEANFSCPNVVTKEGSLYLCPELSFEVASRISAAIDPVPLIVKVGIYPDQQTMTKSFLALSCAGVCAIAGINTLSMKVLNKNKEAALGPSRLKSGVCGSAIRNAGLKFTREARAVIDSEKLSLTLIGGGGIVEAKHFHEFLRAGADFAFTATGMMWEPELAHYAHQLQKEPTYANT